MDSMVVFPNKSDTNQTNFKLKKLLLILNLKDGISGETRII